MTDEALLGRESSASHRRWAFWPYRQFDLVRATDGATYLTRWWIFACPWGGIALHRMTASDARPTLHDHPFSFVSVVLRGGYDEDRLDPRTMKVAPHVVRRVNLVRAGIDAHSIRHLLRVPTWTLLLVGRHLRTWGFWEPTEYLNADLPPRAMWTWTAHDAFDSGHYVPLPGEESR